MTGKKKKRKSKSKRKETTTNSDEHQSEPLADDQTENEHQRQQPKTSVVIAGDSIIKYIKGWELSNADQIVSVKSFSGATVHDMSDFLKPSIRKHPSKLVIQVINLRFGNQSNG